MTSDSRPDQALSRPAILVAGTAIIGAVTWISPLFSIDYWDRGYVGVAASMAVGFAVLSAFAWRLKNPQPLATALFAVGPWAFGLGGAPYVGFVLLALEVLATALILRSLNRRPRLSMPRAVLAAGFARAVSTLPLLV